MGPFDFVVACNDAGTIWPGRPDVWVTLHPEKIESWRDQRRANGHPEAARYLVHGDHVPAWTDLVEFRFPGQGDSGSSGLFTVKAALIDLGADRAVLAGVPLSRAAHFFDATMWEAAGEYRAVFEALRPECRNRIRSMSGWTAEFFGTPTAAWIATGACEPDRPCPDMEASTMPKTSPDKVAYEPHPVTAERKAELRTAGFKIIDARFAPSGHESEPIDVLITNESLAGSGEGNQLAVGDQPAGPVKVDLTDDQLRAAIEAATGKVPHHKTGCAKLLEQYAAVTGAAGTSGD